MRYRVFVRRVDADYLPTKESTKDIRSFSTVSDIETPEFFVKRYIDTVYESSVISLIYDMTYEKGPGFVFINTKTDKAIGVYELRNRVGQISFCHLQQPLQDLQNMLDMIAYKYYPLQVLKLKDTIPNKIIQILKRVGFQEHYSDGSTPIGFSPFVPCIDKTIAPFKVDLWCEVDSELNLIPDEMQGEVEVSSDVERRKKWPYVGCNDVALVLDVTWYKQTCTEDDDSLTDIYLSVNTNPIGIGTLNESTTQILIQNEDDAVPMPLVDRNLLALRADLYAFEVVPNRFVFMDGENLMESSEYRFVPIYTEKQQKIGYALRPKSMSDLKVSHYTKDDQKEQAIELERLRDLSNQYLLKHTKKADMFATYVGEVGSKSYVVLNKYLQQRAQNTTEEKEDLEKYIASMVASIYESGVKTKLPITLHRGIRNTHWNVQQMHFVQESFLSTSSRLLEEFHELRCCSLIINVPAGTPLLNLNTVNQNREDEFLLLPGTALAIDHVYPVTHNKVFTTITCHITNTLSVSAPKQVLQPTTSPSFANEIVLLTLNVQAYLEGSRFAIQEAIEQTNANIICIQEDVEHSSMFLEDDTMNVFRCVTGEHIDKDIQLANTIYTSLPVQHSETLNLTGCPVGRCAVMIEIQYPIPLRIVNVHLCGGRYDDRRFRQLIHVKEQQLKQVVGKWHPDVIVGDFNGQLEPKNLDTHPVYRQLTLESDKLLYVTYHTSGHDYLKSQDYKPVSNQEKTSRFGGTPDWIYIRKNINISKAEIVPFLHLTDHNGILVHVTS